MNVRNEPVIRSELRVVKRKKGEMKGEKTKNVKCNYDNKST